MLRTVAQQLYLAYFGRPADAGGIENFTGILRTFLPETATIADLGIAYDSILAATNLVKNFSASQESRDLYQGGTAQFVDSIYRNILNRPSEEAGRNFWVDAIDKRGLDPAKAALEIITAALRNGERDAQTVLRKTEVAQAFTDGLDTPEEVAAFSGNAAAAQARELLSRVDADTDLPSFRWQVDALISELVNTSDRDGNTFSTATQIQIGSQNSSAFNNLNGPGTDTDLYTFTAQAGQLFEVRLSTNASASYRVLDANGNALIDGFLSSGVQNQRIIKLAPEQTGPLYLDFSSSTPGNTGYSFDLIASADDHADSFFGSTRLQNTVQATGSLNSPTDVDAFKFKADFTKRYFIELDSSAIASGLRTTLDVFSPDLRTVKNFSNPGIVGAESSSRVATIFTANESGDHFLLVNNQSSSNNAGFKLKVTQISQQDATSDTFTNAKDLAFGSRTTEAIDNLFDVDTFKVNLQSGVNYALNLGVQTPKAGQTLSVNLYNANGDLVRPNLILSSESFNQAFSVQSSGQYFIQVNDLNFDSTGNYTLQINQPAVPVDPVIPPPSGNDPFNVTFVYKDGTNAYASIFEQVGAFLQTVIVEGLPTAVLENGRIVDDIEIEVSQRFIDDSFGTLAFAGPQEFRPESQGFLPSAGILVIDTSDAQRMINNGAFFDVMLHEILHALGAGTLWEFFELSGNNRYVGENVLREYRTLTGNSGETFVPVTEDNGHFSELIFGDEMMTPIIDSVDGAIFSRLSIATLDDLGYTVSYNSAEPYVLPVGFSTAEPQQEAVFA